MPKKKFNVIAFVGKSGAGKDYCAHKFCEENPDTTHFIVSSTTRPIRDYEKDGEDYHFLTTEAFMASTFVESTSFNGWFYGTRLGDLRLDRINIGIFNPTGIKALAAKDNINLTIVYVKASDKTRLLRQLNREEEPNVKEIVRRFGTDETDFMDDKDFINLGRAYYEIWNDDRIGQE